MKIFHGRVARIRCLAYSPDGTTLVSAGDRGVVRLWDTQLGRVRSRFRSEYMLRVTGLAYSPDGSTIATALGYEGVTLWSASDGKNLGMLYNRKFVALSAAFRPDGQALLSCGLYSGRTRNRGSAALWDLTTRKAVAHFTSHAQVWTCSISQEGRLIAVGSAAGILFWDPVLDPDGSPVLLDAEHPNPAPDRVTRWVIPQRPEPRFLRFSPDGRLLAACSGWSIHIYGVKKGVKVATLKGHRQVVKSLDFSPDGQILASASHDGTVRFWDPETGDERACFDWEIGAVNCALFAPDGMTIAVGGEGGIVVWDVE